ncbi:hypothetical protein RIF29_40192 [Crotalaria pallida]|uniref:Replication protein A 70 kDa DNA-binding subunit B/D first OB fold domain-containing protein n=1 Tax=Crotalaria pallida TaxID=3830 RepID=A0AAN9E557_CROPI
MGGEGEWKRARFDLNEVPGYDCEFKLPSLSKLTPGKHILRGSSSKPCDDLEEFVHSSNARMRALFDNDVDLSVRRFAHGFDFGHVSDCEVFSSVENTQSCVVECGGVKNPDHDSAPASSSRKKFELHRSADCEVFSSVENTQSCVVECGGVKNPDHDSAPASSSRKKFELHRSAGFCVNHVCSGAGNKLERRAVDDDYASSTFEVGSSSRPDSKREACINGVDSYVLGDLEEVDEELFDDVQFYEDDDDFMVGDESVLDMTSSDLRGVEYSDLGDLSRFDFSDMQIQTLGLVAIEKHLRKLGKSLVDFPNMPLPDMEEQSSLSNQLILEQLDFDRNLLAQEFENLYSAMTAEQKSVFDSILTSVEEKKGDSDRPNGKDDFDDKGGNGAVKAVGGAGMQGSNEPVNVAWNIMIFVFVPSVMFSLLSEKPWILTIMALCLVSDLKIGRETRSLQGDKIQGLIIDQDAMKKHRKYIEEGSVIQLSRFYVGPVTGQCRPTKHPYRININFGTRIEPCGENIASEDFDFVSFEEIGLDEKPEDYLIDIIGVVKEHGSLEPYQYQGEVAHKLMLILANESAIDQVPTQGLSSSQFTNSSQSTIGIALTNPDFRKTLIDIKTIEEVIQVQHHIAKVFPPAAVCDVFVAAVKLLRLVIQPVLALEELDFLTLN